MRGTLIPLPDFLDAAIRACEVSPSTATRYRGIVVVLDRTAERNSNLLKDLADQGSSINDVTRKDLLVALPGRQEDWRPGVQEWVLDPHKVSEHGVNAPGLLLAGADDRAWESRLWELVSDEVERCDSYVDQKRIVQAVDQSASDVVDYLGLTEDDIPSLVIFSLDDRRLFVFRYGGDADDPPYQLFKNIATRRPRDGEPGWLASAVVAVARDLELAEGQAPVLAPPSLANWRAIRYLPRHAGVLPLESARG